DARAVSLQPVVVALDLKADPQPGRAVDAAGHDGARPQARPQFGADRLGEAVDLEGHMDVLGFARLEADRLLLRQRLDQGDAVDAVRVAQGRTRQVHQTGNLLGSLHRAWLELERTEGL